MDDPNLLSAMQQNQPNQPALQSEAVHPNEIYAAVLQEERVTNLISQASPEKQLEEIEWRIRGYKKNSITKQWEKVDPKAPEINDLLVSRYISYLSSLLNENTRFTNLSSGEINAIMRLVIKYFVDDMKSNAEIYGLRTDYTERTRIGHIMLNEIYIVLKRAQNGMESKRIFKTLQIGESLNPFAQQKKKGALEFLKFWKG